MVKTADALDTFAYGFVTASIDFVIVLILGACTRGLYNCRYRNSESQRLAVTQSTENWTSDEPLGRCQLFKQKCTDFVKKVVPNQFELLQLVLAAATLLGSSIFLVWLTAASTNEIICGYGYYEDDCDTYFPHLNASDIDAVIGLKDDVYATMLGTGITLSFPFAFLGPFGVMAMAFYLKGRMATAEAEAKENVSLANYSVQEL